MTAERAIQDLTDSSKITLENIDARLPIESDSWADITAKDGVLDNNANTLDVTSPMTIKTSTGMLAVLQSAFVDMKSGSVISSEPVNVEMDGSTLTAQTMAVEDRGRVVVFENRVRMTLLPERLKKRERDE